VDRNFEHISATVQTLAQQIFFFEVIVNYCLACQSRKSYSMFDPLMREHWNPVFDKAWILSHFTSDTQELISLLTARVGQTSVISSIQKAKYYGIIFDMTLDGTYMEQMSKILRFVKIQRHHVENK